MTIRVVHLIGGGEIGGAEQHVLNLCTGFDREQVTPFLVCLINHSAFAELAKTKVDTHVFPMRFSADLSPVLSLVSFCRKQDIDIIHCHGLRANLIGRLASRLLKRPCISTVHSLPEHDYVSAFKARLFLAVDNFTLPLSSGIITISGSLKDYMNERLKKLPRPVPLRTIANGIGGHDFSQAPALRESFRDHWQIPHDRCVIGSIGRLHPVKGHTFLVEALKHVRKENANIHLLIIGDGPLQAQLRDELDASGIPFTLTGYMPMAWQALPAMDIFVLPSLSEGMGIVLLEAAQAGIPIVASHTGGIPELIDDKTEGLLVKPGDILGLTIALSDILQNPALAAKLTANAAHKAGQYTLQKMAQETTSFYEQFLA